MLAVIVSVVIRPEHEERFLTAITRQAALSLSEEEGCLRFDIVRDREDANHFLLYEIYGDDAAFYERHRSTAHFAEWAAEADVVLAEPRTTTVATLIGDDA